ncbi:MAG: hypothetical protein JWP97_5931 [Labilithrix sp.]|nr:hypothetical protein [Labilithrix sp.]
MSAALLAAAALLACTPASVPVPVPPPSPPARRAVLPLRFELVAEAASGPANRSWHLMALSSGAVLVENRTDGWSARVAHGREPFRSLEALGAMRETGASWTAAPVGEASGKMWFAASFYDPRGPAQDVAIEVDGARATVMRDIRVHQVLPTPGGGALMLASQGTHRTLTAIGGSRATPPSIPADVDIIDADITPGGELHAFGARKSDPRQLVGLVATSTGKAHTFPLPWTGDYDSSRTLLHGYPSFLYVAAFGETVLAERDGKAVVVAGMPSLFQAAASPAGDIFFQAIDGARPVPKSAVGAARLEPRATALPESPLPDEAALGASGAAACTRIQGVKQLLVSGDGTVWLNVYCGLGATAILRSVR